MYNDQFFGNAMTEDEYRRRLRVVIQNTLTEIEKASRKEGHARVIVDIPEEEVLGCSEKSPDMTISKKFHD